MIKVIAHVVRTLNIKDADDLVFDRVEAELAGIEDVVKYIGYIEKYNNHMDMQYMTGYQKFLELTKKYKAGVAERKAQPQIEAGKTRAKELAEKVKKLKGQFDESEYQREYLGYNHKQLNFHSFTGYFTDEDTAILKTVGNLSVCLGLQSSASGEDALELNIAEILKSIAIKNVSTVNMLTDGTNKNAMKLAQNIARKM